MNQKIRYSYRFIPGDMEVTSSLWADFQAAGLENQCDPNAVHFVPALGGCFLVVQDEQDPGWVQAVRRVLPAPLKPPQSLVEDFWDWLQAERPLIAPGKVMVIDDDPAILMMLRIVLESAGYTVQAFSGAQIALDAVKKLQAPDLMVVDMRMPGMDGRQFVQEIKDRDLDSKIIIVSAYEAKRAEQELHADASLQKPFAPDDLVSLANSLGRPVPPVPAIRAS